GCGVARDHERLHALRHEVVHDAEGECAHLGDRSRAVGPVRGVADVQDGLVRQLIEDRAGDGEAPHSGVEHPDGCVGRHGCGHGSQRTERPGAALRLARCGGRRASEGRAGLRSPKSRTTAPKSRNSARLSASSAARGDSRNSESVTWARESLMWDAMWRMDAGGAVERSRGQVGACPNVSGMRRTARLPLPLLLITLVLAGCTQPDPMPTPPPTPSAAPVFASDEEALAAAEEAYGKYLETVDAILADGGSNAERLKPLVTSALFEHEREGFATYASK